VSISPGVRSQSENRCSSSKITRISAPVLGKRVGVSACRRAGVSAWGGSAWPRVRLVGTRSRAIRRGTSINREHPHKNAGIKDKELRGVEPCDAFGAAALSY